MDVDLMDHSEEAENATQAHIDAQAEKRIAALEAALATETNRYVAEQMATSRLAKRIAALERLVALARDVADGYPAHPPVFGSACPCSLCQLRAALEG